MSQHEGRSIQGAVRTFLALHYLSEPEPIPMDNIVKLYGEYVDWAETYGEAKMYYYQFKNEIAHLEPNIKGNLNHV